MARDYFYFGVEIELIAEPHRVRHPLVRKFYYEKLAASLRHHGLDAVADSLKGRYRKHPEHYDKWFLTKDGSLGNPDHPASESLLFVVSARNTNIYGRIESSHRSRLPSPHWESEIDRFWTAWGRVFKLPRRSAKCGSHIHVSPGPNKRFTLTELKKIACGIVFYANNLNDMLPAPRRNNAYCQKNWEASSVGVWYENGSDEDVRQTMRVIWDVADEKELNDFMQEDRRVMWNFEHIVPGDSCTGTVEFRGGRGLRGPNRTKWWIAFVLSFIQLCISSKRFPNKSPSERPQTDYFWRKVRRYASTIHVADDLPPDWQNLNESYRFVPFALHQSTRISPGFETLREMILTSPRSSAQWEDAVDSDEDESEMSSIVSKDASEYWDSDYSVGDEIQWANDMEQERRDNCVIL